MDGSLRPGHRALTRAARLTALAAVAALATACSMPCELARQELAYSAPPPEVYPEDRWAIGLSMSRSFVNRILDEVVAQGDGFEQSRPISLNLPPPLNGLAGTVNIRIVDLEMVGPGECKGCVRVAVNALLDAGLAGVTLPQLDAEAVGELRLTTRNEGSTVHVLGSLEDIQDLDFRVEGTQAKNLLRDAIMELAQRLGGPIAAGVAQMVLGNKRMEALQDELDGALRKAAAKALGSAAKAALPPDGMELTRLQAPPFGTALLTAERIEVRAGGRGLFLGIDPAGWPLEDTVGAVWHDDDLTLSAGSSSLAMLLQTAISGGVLPPAIDENGRTGPDARYKLQARAARPVPEGFDLTVRLWRTDRNCGWVDLSARLTAEVAADDLDLELTDFRPVAAKGGGRRVASGLRLYNTFSKDNLEIAQKLAASSRVKVLGRDARWTIRAVRSVGDRGELAMTLGWADAPEKPEKRP